MLLALLLACRHTVSDDATGAPSPTADTATATPFTSPEDPGPYDVGFTTITFTDPRGKQLTAEVWYPAVPQSGDPDRYEPLPIQGNAHRDAAPAEGAPFPLLAFSHGFAGIRYQSIFLTEHLAGHGFVIVSPDHPNNTFLDLEEELSGQVLYERPDDIRFTVDEALRRSAAGDPILGGLLEPDAGYGMVGHSFGAITTMVLAGGIPDYEGVLTFCKTGDSLACRYITDIDGIDAEGHGTRDERVRWSVPMSPGLPFAFQLDGSGLAPVTNALVLAGDRDDVLPYDTEALPVFAGLGHPKTLATFADGGHYAFSDICLILAPLFPDCAEPDAGWIDIPQAQRITRTVVTAYFGLHIKGDDRYTPWLEADTLAAFPELTWTVEP